MKVDSPPVLSRYRELIEPALAQAFPSPDGPLARLHEAMRYSLDAGGKRLRPALCFASCEAVGAPPRSARSAASALELVHTYSLIHDDLPCMDDDDTRRSRPTNHRVYGEALAVLSGDALLTRAFGRIAEDDALPADIRTRMIATLASAAGSLGMVGGQALDLAAEGRDVDLVELEGIHARKTGALFGATCRLGALAGAGNDEQVDGLERFGQRIGLAFQIMDDVLDETASQEALGKASGKDRSRGKATYPGLLGLSASRARIEAIVGESEEVLGPFGEAGEPLRELARFIAERSS